MQHDARSHYRFQRYSALAFCRDLVLAAGAECDAFADVDNGSYDPDGDSILLTQEPAGPYPLGNTLVTLTVADGQGATDTCTAIVTVQDGAAPTVSCNAPMTITPPDAPISFAATATDNCGLASVEVAGYDCYWYNPAEKRVDKTSSCVATYSGDTITIHDTGGVKDTIEWFVMATDASGNSPTMTCKTQVVNPAQQ